MVDVCHEPMTLNKSYPPLHYTVIQSMREQKRETPYNKGSQQLVEIKERHCRIKRVKSTNSFDLNGKKKEQAQEDSTCHNS